MDASKPDLRTLKKFSTNPAAAVEAMQAKIQELGAAAGLTADSTTVGPEVVAYAPIPLWTPPLWTPSAVDATLSGDGNISDGGRQGLQRRER